MVDLVTLALYLSEGDSKLVDTEDVASKAHELDPRFFRWRTREDQINLELVRVSLSNAKKNRFAWVEGCGRAGWSLTSGGRRRAIELQNALAPPKTLAGAQGRAGAGRGIADSRRAIESRRIRSTRAWEMWSRGTRKIVARDAAAVFRIDVYSTGRTRNMKINRLQSLFLEIAEIREFLTEMSRILE